MSDSTSPKDIRHLLEALDSSISEDDASCFNLTNKEADERLAELKIDPQPALRQLDQILEAARGQARMERGRARREKFAIIFVKCQETVRKYAPKSKEEILGILKGISPDKSEAVEAYFRKFEQSSDKDVQSLREDLEMLRTIKQADGNDGESDKS